MLSLKDIKNGAFYKECHLFNFMILLSIASILLFLYGFFPITTTSTDVASLKDLPNLNENSMNLSDVYKPEIQRLIIMVIDAWRWDFVSNLNETMPHLSNILSNGKGCMYNVKVHPPTVTMPRIKAITSGVMPNYVDIALNFGAKSVSHDNILLQMKSHGHKLIFYGDDIWLKLFPNIFDRYEETDSFYVTDFTEVDTNVTRNMNVEIDRNDWSVMVLHYLGLDHIGHMHGAFSPLIKPKLQEMDDIIDKITTKISKWNQDRNKTLFIVSGDHGMKDSGSHGGSSLQESQVPLAVIGKSCVSNKQIQNKYMWQIDIAPTISVLLGIPIPKSNLGTLILELIDDLPISRKLFLMNYNAHQIFLQFTKLNNYQQNDCFETYKKATKLYSDWLQQTENSGNKSVEKILALYKYAINDMKNLISNYNLKYNTTVITFAVISLIQILYICLTEKSMSMSLSSFFIVSVITFLVWVTSNYILYTDSEMAYYSGNMFWIFDSTTVFLLCILVVNSYLCAQRFISVQKIIGLQKFEVSCIVGLVLHTISFASSSFVEEEHQTWYYFWVTLILIFALNTVNSATTALRIEPKANYHRTIVVLLFLLASHRVLRCLNSTGDQYAHLPDISDSLINDNTKIGMTLIVILGLAALVMLNTVILKTVMSIEFFITSLMALCIYSRHVASDAVLRPGFYPSSRGMYEVKFFWLLFITYILYNLYKLPKISQYSKLFPLQSFLLLLIKIWTLLSCLIHRPYNLILLPMQLITGFLIPSIAYGQNKSLDIYLNILSSNVFYFYQGNSNSLATIDLSAGYVGLEAYRPVIIGFQLIVNTYSAPVLGFFIFIYNIIRQDPNSSAQQLLPKLKLYLFWRLLPMTFYAIIVYIQRYHLFIWSVFSPKLLYEATHCGVLMLVIWMMHICIMFSNNNYYLKTV